MYFEKKYLIHQRAHLVPEIAKQQRCYISWMT